MKSIELPQIILSNSSNFLEIGQCDCNCDCACETSAARWSDSMLPEVFKTRTPTFDLMLPKGNRILANVQHGSPAVLNEAAYKMLQTCKQPITLEKLAINAGMSMDQAQPFLYGLLQAGLVETESEAIATPPQRILSAWLHIVNDCQLACDYCYVHQSHERMSLQVGEASIQKLINVALSYSFKALKIKFAGGEPTLNFGLVCHLAGMAKQLCFESGLELEQVILTNGLRWDMNMIQTAIDLGLRVMVSLDSLMDSPRRMRSGLDSSTLVKSTIERMLKSGLIPMISVTVSDQSLTGLPDLARWLLKNRLPFSLNFQRLDLSHNPNEYAFPEQEKLQRVMSDVFTEIESNLPRYSLLNGLLDRVNLSAAHDHVCGVGQNYLVIDSSGRIAQCQMAINQTVGDLSDPDPLGTVRRSETAFSNPSAETKPDCRDCDIRGWCAGGCPLDSLRRTGSSQGSSQFCKLIRKLVPEVLYLEGVRLAREMDQPC